MANHCIDCDYCGEDMRGTTMRMCKSHEEAKDCYLYQRAFVEAERAALTEPSTTFAFDAATGKPVAPTRIISTGSPPHAPARIEDVHRRSSQYAAALGELKQKIRTPFVSTLSHEEALERLRQINLLSY
ncbi:hypothetical protein [Microvirga sp. Mcv34]|uniref:hypothetical protein n=1 Tax=Microvirga sp. Mcv34 TaxID=2926016 RepID=UPI0021C816A5|nr:hypothetical protein [Microvirga sp. Mcv34]